MYKLIYKLPDLYVQTYRTNYIKIDTLLTLKENTYVDNLMKTGDSVEVTGSELQRNLF